MFETGFRFFSKRHIYIYRNHQPLKKYAKSVYEDVLNPSHKIMWYIIGTVMNLRTIFCFFVSVERVPSYDTLDKIT